MQNLLSRIIFIKAAVCSFLDKFFFLKIDFTPFNIIWWDQRFGEHPADINYAPLVSSQAPLVVDNEFKIEEF